MITERGSKYLAYENVGCVLFHTHDAQLHTDARTAIWLIVF